MNSVKYLKNVLKVIVIGVLFIFVVSSRAYADEPINFDNLNFDNIPEAGSTTSSSTSTSTSTTNSTTTTDTTTSTKNTTKNTTSATKSKMPATGSNTEIIFVVAGTVLVVAGVVLFRRQNIKLK